MPTPSTPRGDTAERALQRAKQELRIARESIRYLGADVCTNRAALAAEARARIDTFLRTPKKKG